MAVTHSKSTTITNYEAAQQTLANKTKIGGVLCESIETFELTADSATSTTRYFRVHSGWRLKPLAIYSDDSGAAGIVDIGLYDTTENGGAVVDVDFFAASLDVNAAALDGTLKHAAVAAENLHKELWEQLSLTSDPNKWYDVAVTISTALSGTSTMTLALQYVDGN
jgi:hypothetical protein